MGEEMKYEVSILYQIVTFFILFIYIISHQLRDRYLIAKANGESLLGKTDPKVACKHGKGLQGEKFVENK